MQNIQSDQQQYALWDLELTSDGRIARAFLKSGGQQIGEIGFRSDTYGGPQWYGEWGGKQYRILLTPSPHVKMGFEGTSESLYFGLSYDISGEFLVITATIQNTGNVPFRPIKAGLRLGLDTYMDQYPDWDQKFFPTLLRCEKTHFWGYFMSPAGCIIGIGSPDPIASWSLEYNQTDYEGTKHFGHRIYTVNLDLLNAPPLPERHPENLSALEPGETKTWKIFLFLVEELHAVKRQLADVCQAPMIHLERHTLAQQESTDIQVWSCEDVTLQDRTPQGQAISLTSDLKDKQLHHFSFTPPDQFGVYTLVASIRSGKQAEARLYVRKPWSWYLIHARKEAIKSPQKPSTHLETWYGHFSNFLARKYFPDPDLDSQAEQNFRRILPFMYDIKAQKPLIDAGRINNTACMISLLVDIYEAKGDMADLELAAGLADWLITRQDDDGSYRGGLKEVEQRHFHAKKDGQRSSVTETWAYYTSVVYIAKSMLELADREKRLGKDQNVWEQRYQRHYQSAKAAVDDLLRRKDNIGTEGEHTFEDGMIACTALQLACFALHQTESEERKRYTEAAVYVLNKHRCLEQLLIPDCRMHGGTLRFWEAQYDVLIYHNMMTSPHGWTSWKTYATWYLYLLTGDEHFLRQTMDTLGSCMQMIDVDTGKLRWAFVNDPYIRTDLWQENPEHPGHGIYIEGVIGEQYVDMISDWWQAPPDTVVTGHQSMTILSHDTHIQWSKQGGCCDNDVHEHFKCLAEITLTSAYIVERDDGEIVTWNCRVEVIEQALHVHPAEDIVQAIHVNLKQTYTVTSYFTESAPLSKVCSGMQWIRNNMIGPILK